MFFIKKFIFKLVSDIWTKKLKPKGVWANYSIYTIFFEKYFSLKTCSFK